MIPPEWQDAGDNLWGVLRGRGLSDVVESFVRAGWTSRPSSWCAYEVGTTWCEAELDAVGETEILLSGVTDPDGLDALAALLSRSGLGFRLELYDGNGELRREIIAAV
ncbi:hypothetical protein ACSNOK_12955 [Streptomyces sp. URMC 126]|uniref:hypothetical protein n=1 Tax=Streptomyces sp. URMC 126 TaxID=3423401 RepID=UPI003F1A78D3